MLQPIRASEVDTPFKRIKFAEERAKAVKTVLAEDYKIPESNINVVIHKRKAVKIPAIKVSILIAQGRT